MLLHALAARPGDAAARRAAQAALSVLGRIAATFPVARCREQRMRAEYCRILGRKRRAARHLRSARGWARKLGLGAELRELEL